MLRKIFLSLIFILVLQGNEILAQDQESGQKIKDFKNTNTPGKVTDVWVVIKSHFDLGYTDLAANVFQRYRVEMMDNALKVIDEDRKLPSEKRFVWTVPGWPLWAQMLGPEQDQSRKARVEQAVREGAIRVHALPFTMHTESLDLEDLVRGLEYSCMVCRKYGKPLPIAAKMTDVPSHSWVLPILLNHAGIKFLHLGDNSASQYPRVPSLFWWEGPDGSRILCNYNASYGSSIIPPADWPLKNYLSMVMAGDNIGPPGPADVEKLRNEYEQQLPGVKVHFGTLDDFARAALAENPKLPVVRGDMPDTWIHGLMANPEASKIVRNVRPLEPALETLDTQLQLWGLATTDASGILAEAYEQSLLYGEHTWGMNSDYGPRNLFGDDWKQWMTEMRNEPLPADNNYMNLPKNSKRKWMQSYQDHRNYAANAEKLINGALSERLRLLAASVKTNGKSLLIYNALPWKRSGIVEVSGTKYMVNDVPANGYKTVPFKEEKVKKVNASTIETNYFKAIFDLEKGGISSLIDKESNKELVDQKSEYVLGQFLHERFSSKEVYDRFFNQYSRIKAGWGMNDFGKPGMPDESKVPYMAITPSGWEMSVSETGTELCVLLKASDCKGLAKGYSLTFSFPKSMPYVEFCWKVDEKTAEKHPEGGWLCFPFNILKPLFAVGRLGAPIDPAKDIISGANRHLYAVNTGTAITGNSGGVGLCAIDSPLQSLGLPGLWRWSMDYIPEVPTVFVNLYNNMWNTNFPLWQDGSWSERVRIWPVSKNENTNENLMVHSWEARLPLLSEIADNPDGKLAPEQAGLTLSRKGILVTAFGKNLDGEGTILRVWEQAGISNRCIVSLPKESEYKTAIPVDLRGEIQGRPIEIINHHLSFDLGKFTPKSFVLK